MAFDQTTRNRLQKFVSDARKVLTEEFTRQLQSTYGIDPESASVTPVERLQNLDDTRRETAKILRATLDHYQTTNPTEDTKALLDRIVREHAFTILNRLAALRMAEARGLLIESLANGYNAKGFQLYARLAGSGLGDKADAYRCYLLSLFDEFALDLRVLFDRFSPTGRLFPREAALLDVLKLMNDAEVAPLWAEDETIGWIYQYFNSKEERKKMRDESAAPRNSRELAVRNQFFTPRYVVEFLTDNTLGRLWYETTRGNTHLKDQCRYLVRRPMEIFLGEQRQAHEAIFNDSSLTFGEVVAAAYRGDLSKIPDDDGMIASSIAVALPPDQFEKITGEPYEPFENDRIGRLIDAVLSDEANPDAENLLMMWAAVSRFTLNDGGGAYSIKPWKKLWAKFVEVARKPTPENLTQEELLKQPVYIPHRPLKDPRAIRVLDPACGSMHFGLYAFDLLAVIYDEAWELEATQGADAWQREPGDAPLRESYADKEAFLRDVPRLIIERNLHGIDIDPRAVQIAGLSLWLRAQRAWQQQGVKSADRPQVRRSNIVCAEPMPGEEALLNEFIARHLAATPELRLVAELVRRVFRAMKLAGEAGSLLKIEEEVAGAVAEAKAQWQTESQAQHEQGSLFADIAKHEQQRLAFEVAEITDESFWERAESSIYTALREYAEQAENGGGYQRRLFAEDAARGFAFIDICQKRYDVVLMNPPFGPSAEKTVGYLASVFPDSKHDLALCAVERTRNRLEKRGFLGAIITRTPLFLPTSFEWRQDHLLGRLSVLQVMADFGVGVLDATVESAAFTIQGTEASDNTNRPALFVKAIETEEKAERLLSIITQFAIGQISKPGFFIRLADFSAIPFSPLSYWTPESIRCVFRTFPSFQNEKRDAKCGLGTLDDFRFLRLSSEVGVSKQAVGESTWANYADGGSFTPFYESPSAVVNWKGNGKEVKVFVTQKVGSASRKVQGASFYFSSGLTFPRRTKRFCPRPLPQGFIFSTAGQGIFLSTRDELVSALGILSTDVCKYFISLSLGTNSQDQGGTNPQFEVGLIKRLPWPANLENSVLGEIVELCLTGKMSFESVFEDSRLFYSPSRKPLRFANIEEHTNDFDELASTLSVLFRKSVDQLNEIAAKLYGLSGEDLNLLQNELGAEEDTKISSLNQTNLSQSILALILGTLFGRWDIRFATGEKPAPELPDPFAPLPVCPPGMMQNKQGLPAVPADVPASYPLRISWPGILVDDKGHAEDIERRVREALHVIWQERADAIEQEACEILGVKTLRDYFRKPASFFADHLKCYSKSRRQAPIYWPLSTRSGDYTLWLYYHRLNDQTLYSCVNDFIEPKLRDEITPLVNGLRAKGTNRTREEEKEFERWQDFEQELQELRDELLRLAQLPWRPNLNDGVQITAAPLWSLFRLPKWQKTLKETWGTLQKGDYDWAHLAMTIWPERVVLKCTKDRSLAIAHDVEDLFWVEDVKGWRTLESPRQESKTQTERQRSAAKDRARQLLAEFAQGNDGAISATDIGDQLAAGAFDDRELTLLLYPARMAEVVWEAPVLAQRLGVKMPPKKTKAARDKFIKETVKQGCAEVGLMLEAALSGRAKSFAEVWAEIERGDHDDLALALALWPDRVVDKCTNDVTLAEIQGLRKFFWVQHPGETWRKRISIEEEITNEVARRRGVPASA